MEWLAPLPLAFAVAWAGKAAGYPLNAAVGGAITAFFLGFAVIKRVGGKAAPTSYGFAPAAYEGEPFSRGELLLGPQDEVLILDDPLVEVAPEARVVRLFARQELTPGELVERIADFLGEDRPVVTEVRIRAEIAPPVDASAALHAALANIRASLR